MVTNGERFWQRRGTNVPHLSDALHGCKHSRHVQWGFLTYYSRNGVTLQVSTDVTWEPDRYNGWLTLSADTGLLHILILVSVARSCERNKRGGLWKQAQNKQDHYSLHTHINITLNPEMYWIESLHLLLFLYVMILFCFSSRTSKQYDIQYNRKRIEETRDYQYL